MKNVDIELKLLLLICSWIFRLHKKFQNGWKVISLNYINNALGINFKFHYDLSIPNRTIKSLLSYYKDTTDSWWKNYSCSPEVPSSVSKQCLWYNSYTKIDNKIVCRKDFADKRINYISIFFDENGESKSWQKMLTDFQLTQTTYFEWFQLIHTISHSWKLAVLNDKGDLKNIICLNHHLIKNNQILAIEKLIPRELYSWSIFLRNEPPRCQIYFSNIFSNLHVEWQDIYFSPPKVSIDTNLCMLQNKMPNNVLYLNKQLLIYN